MHAYSLPPEPSNLPYFLMMLQKYERYSNYYSANNTKTHTHILQSQSNRSHFRHNHIYRITQFDNKLWQPSCTS